MTRGLFCIVLHREEEQLTTTLNIDGKLIEYPNICYRCNPDDYIRKWYELEEKYQMQKIESMFQ